MRSVRTYRYILVSGILPSPAAKEAKHSYRRANCLSVWATYSSRSAYCGNLVRRSRRRGNPRLNQYIGAALDYIHTATRTAPGCVRSRRTQKANILWRPWTDRLMCAVAALYETHTPLPVGTRTHLLLTMQFKCELPMAAEVLRWHQLHIVYLSASHTRSNNMFTYFALQTT